MGYILMFIVAEDKWYIQSCEKYQIILNVMTDWQSCVYAYFVATDSMVTPIYYKNVIHIDLFLQ